MTDLSDKEEFEKFILYGIEEKIPFKKCIENVFLLFLFFAFFLIVDVILESRDYVLRILFLAPVLLYFISVIILTNIKNYQFSHSTCGIIRQHALCGKEKLIDSEDKLKIGREIEGAHSILHNGILAACFSYLFGLTGYKMLFSIFGGKERVILSCIAGMGYILVVLLWSYIIKRWIRKRKYSHNKWSAVTVSSVSALAGMTIAKTYLNRMDQNTVKGIMCILVFFLSYLSLIGIVNIFKYQYIKKHPEILVRDEQTNAGKKDRASQRNRKQTKRK